MKNQKQNPIAIRVQPMAGRQMPSDWNQKTNEFGGTFDRRDLSSMWKNPNWSSKLNGDNVENLVRNSRLSSLTASGI
jgi:hypothetical protein